MKTAHMALGVALWSATGCVVSSKLLGRSGSRDTPSSARSSGSSNDPARTAAATEDGDATDAPREAPPELAAEPLDPAYRPYQPENAKRLIAELEAVDAGSGKRSRPDDEILIELFVHANALYAYGDKEQKPWAVQMWTRGKELATTPPTSARATRSSPRACAGRRSRSRICAASRAATGSAPTTPTSRWPSSRSTSPRTRRSSSPASRRARPGAARRRQADRRRPPQGVCRAGRQGRTAARLRRGPGGQQARSRLARAQRRGRRCGRAPR